MVQIKYLIPWNTLTFLYLNHVNPFGIPHVGNFSGEPMHMK